MSDTGQFKLRKHKRASVRLPVMLIYQGNAYEALMLELSRGGALIETSLEVPTGTLLLLGFHIKNVPDVIELPVSVRYVHKPGDDRRLGEHQGLGLRFEEIGEELGERIDTYVKDQRFFGPYSSLLKEFRRSRR